MPTILKITREIEMELISKDLKNITTYLRISRILPTLPERLSYARAKKLSYEEFLELILSNEKERREARLLNLRLKKANVSNLDGYDWNTSTTYDREIVKKALYPFLY